MIQLNTDIDFVIYSLPNSMEVHLIIQDAVGSDIFEAEYFDKTKRLQICGTRKTISSFEFKVNEINQKLSSTSYNQYKLTFDKIIDEIHEGNISKVIASRIQKINISKHAWQDIFSEARISDRNAFLYLFNSTLLGTWFGVSPEAIAIADQKEIKTIALAGTRITGASGEWGEKELEEHEWVEKYFESTFNANNWKYTQGDKYTQIAGKMEHIARNYSVSTNMDFKQFVEEIHPTPAVCGIPKSNAFDLILKTEKHSREFYTGSIITSSSNFQNAFVNIRCARIFQNEAILYLGGGITKDSNMEDEWNETELKSKTIASLLAND